MPSFPIQVVDKNKGLTIPPRVDMKNFLSGGEGRFAVFCIPHVRNTSFVSLASDFIELCVEKQLDLLERTVFAIIDSTIQLTDIDYLS